MVAREPEDLEPLRVALEAGRKVGLDQKDLGSASDLLQKLEEREQPLVFTDLLAEDMERLQAARTREQAVAVLMRCFGLSLEHGFNAEVLAEFHYHNFVFCQQQKFCVEKASTFLSLMKVVHTRAILEERLDVQAARAAFEALLARHSRQLPPFSVGAFSRQEAAAIRAFADRNFFRLYKLHEFLRDRRKDLRIRVVSESVIPRAVAPARLHSSHEVVAEQVPELQELFTDPQAEALAAQEAANAAAAATAAAEKDWSVAVKASEEVKDSPVGRLKAAISEAVDQGVEARLESLSEKLDVPP